METKFAKLKLDSLELKLSLHDLIDLENYLDANLRHDNAVRAKEINDLLIKLSDKLIKADFGLTLEDIQELGQPGILSSKQMAAFNQLKENLFPAGENKTIAPEQQNLFTQRFCSVVNKMVEKTEEGLTDKQKTLVKPNYWTLLLTTLLTGISLGTLPTSVAQTIGLSQAGLLAAIVTLGAAAIAAIYYFPEHRAEQEQRRQKFIFLHLKRQLKRTSMRSEEKRENNLQALADKLGVDINELKKAENLSNKESDLRKKIRAEFSANKNTIKEYLKKINSAQEEKQEEEEPWLDKRGWINLVLLGGLGLLTTVFGSYFALAEGTAFLAAVSSILGPAAPFIFAVIVIGVTIGLLGATLYTEYKKHELEKEIKKIRTDINLEDELFKMDKKLDKLLQEKELTAKDVHVETTLSQDNRTIISTHSSITSLLTKPLAADTSEDLSNGGMETKTQAKKYQTILKSENTTEEEARVGDRKSILVSQRRSLTSAHIIRPRSS